MCSRHTDLHDECIEIEGILVQHDPSTIADHLVNDTKQNADGKPPSFPSEAEHKMYNASNAKECNERRVCTKAWSVLVNTGCDRTYC